MWFIFFYFYFFFLLVNVTIAFDIPAFQEPVKDEGDIIKFFEESGLPVALDETIDCIQENPLNILMKYTHPGIVAIVSYNFLGMIYG